MKKCYSFLLMYLSFFIYSLSGIAIKIAGTYEFFSIKYLLLIAVSIGILGVYAILWQIILKNVDLSIAMANRSVIFVMALLWSVLLFKEQFTIKMLVGMISIFTGVLVLNYKGKFDE